MRNQAVPLMGGLVSQAGLGGRLIGATDSNLNPTGDVHALRSFLSTLLDVVGVDHLDHFPESPISALFG